MKLFFILILFSVVSCSQRPVNHRKIASFYTDIQYGDPELTKSEVRQFPPEVDRDIFRYYFYVSLKDAQGDYVDQDASDFMIRNKSKKEVFFKFHRILRGRYYLIVEKKINQKNAQLEILLNGIPLKEMRLPLSKPARKHSHISVVSRKKHRLLLSLNLADEKGKPVDVPGKPEIILDGNAFIDRIERVGPGKWHISMTYSDENQIIYLSVRSNGAYFKNLFRFQHIEF